MKGWKREIKFTRGERDTMIGLAICLLLSYGYTFLAKPTLQKFETKISLEDLITEIEKKEYPNEKKYKARAKQKAKRVRTWKKKSYKKKKSKYPPLNLTAFNPNETDSLKWLELGVRPWTIKTIKKYLGSGGTFRACDDLKKIYNLPDSTHSKLSPYCNIPERSRSRNYKSKYPKPSTKIVHLNKADTADLRTLKGIGPVLAQRIVNYRDMIGGFDSTAQLTKVFGVEPEVFAQNRKRLIITKPPDKISLNAPIERLVRHRHIDWNLAKVITSYKNQHGDFTELEDLKKILIINDSLYLKLEPYLTVE